MRQSDILRTAADQITANKMRSFFNVLGIVVSIAFLVAVVAIIQGMNAYVKENVAEAVIGANAFQVRARTREIGVRKALGATQRDVLIQFLIEAATRTFVGGLIGIAVGLAIGQGLTTLIDIEATTPLGYTLVAVIVSIGIGIVFGVAPARRAAKLDPIEALRYE